MFTVAWWYMLVTYAAIWAGVIVEPFWIVVAIFLCFVQIVHFGIEDKNFFSFSCQVRYVLAGILWMGLSEPFGWICWIPIVGLTVRLTTNYCLMARLVSLLSWNRRQPLTWALARDRIFSKPVPGAIISSKNK